MLKKKSLCIVIPIYNDWQSLELLLREISESLTTSFDTRLLIINDGSTEVPPADFLARNKNLELLNLRRTLGHQKAIAIGLSYLADQTYDGMVVVMDGDGEDNPADIPLLVEKNSETPSHIVFAKRLKRKEGTIFLLFYSLYKFTFKLLTGKTIAFGNFCLIPGERIVMLAHISEIWNHFSGGIIRSKLPFSTVALDRRKRIAGKSKMNLISLVIHAISSISVHIDVVAVRLLVFFGVLIAFSFVGILIVVGIKVFTTLAIPGWASTVGIGLTLVILQSFFVLLMLSFVILSYRSQKLFIPALDYKDYILKIDQHA